MSATKITISGQQCKAARAALKWNPQDLASRTRIHVRKIEKFERNQEKLLRPENEEIVEAFSKKGVSFTKDGKVHTKHVSSASDDNAANYIAVDESGAIIDIASITQAPSSAEFNEATEKQKIIKKS